MSEAEHIVKTLLENDPQAQPADNPDPDNFDPKDYAIQDKEERDHALAELKAKGDINAKTAATLRHGDYVYHKTVKRADGSAAGAKITSVKLWKTRPHDFEVRWKYGMYEFGTIAPHNAADWTLNEPPPVPRPKKKRNQNGRQ